MQIVSIGDNGMKCQILDTIMLNHVFWGKIRNYFKLSSAENFTQSAKR